MARNEAGYARYISQTVEYLRWMRGSGVEAGAGPVFGLNFGDRDPTHVKCTLRRYQRMCVSLSDALCRLELVVRSTTTTTTTNRGMR